MLLVEENFQICCLFSICDIRLVSRWLWVIALLGIYIQSAPLRHVLEDNNQQLLITLAFGVRLVAHSAIAGERLFPCECEDLQYYNHRPHQITSWRSKPINSYRSRNGNMCMRRPREAAAQRVERILVYDVNSLTTWELAFTAQLCIIILDAHAQCMLIDRIIYSMAIIECTSLLCT